MQAEIYPVPGPLVRIGPNEVLCTDVAELHRISSVKAGYTKHAWYKFGQMKPGVDSVFTTIDPEERREKKRKITPAYAGKGTDSFEEGIDRGVAGLLESIQTRYADKEGVAMDLTRQLHYAALDTLGEVAYSTPLGFLKNNRDMGNFIQINDKILPIMFILSEYTSIFKMMHHWPFSYLLPREGDAVGAGAVLGLVSERTKRLTVSGLGLTKELLPDSQPRWSTTGCEERRNQVEISCNLSSATVSPGKSYCKKSLYSCKSPLEMTYNGRVVD